MNDYKKAKMLAIERRLKKEKHWALFRYSTKRTDYYVDG